MIYILLLVLGLLWLFIRVFFDNLVGFLVILVVFMKVDFVVMNNFWRLWIKVSIFFLVINLFVRVLIVDDFDNVLNFL